MSIGVGCYLIIVAGFFGCLWHAWRLCKVDAQGKSAARREALLLGTGTAILAAMVGGFFDHYLFNLVYPYMSTLFWIFLGLGMATALPPLAANLSSGGIYGHLYGRPDKLRPCSARRAA